MGKQADPLVNDVGKVWTKHDMKKNMTHLHKQASNGNHVLLGVLNISNLANQIFNGLKSYQNPCEDIVYISMY